VLELRYLGEGDGLLLVSELFDRAEEDLGRELVIVIRASSYRQERVYVFEPRFLPYPSRNDGEAKAVVAKWGARIDAAAQRQMETRNVG